MYSNTEPLDEMIFFMLVIFSTKYNENKIMFYNYIYYVLRNGSTFSQDTEQKSKSAEQFQHKMSSGFTLDLWSQEIKIDKEYKLSLKHPCTSSIPVKQKALNTTNR